MIGAENQERRGNAIKDLIEHLHDPTKLRLLVAAAMLGIGYAVAYLPIQTNIAVATEKLNDARRRLTLAEDVESLRKQFRTIQPRIPSGDANQWMQYLLATLRQSPLKMSTFSPGRPQPLGDYQVLSLRVTVSGSFREADQFLCWLESNPRLFRVDSITLAPGSGNSDDVTMSLSISGIMS
jgi:Tfp pilus assembly protein PilO